MSGANGNGSPRYFAMLRMQAIEHKIGLRNPMNRVYYAILRCSICHPHQTEIAVRPEINGSFESFVAQLHERIKKQRPVQEQDIKEERAKRDHRGEPVPLSWQDLESVADVWRAQVGKSLERLRSEGVIAEGWPFRPIAVPTVVPPFESIGLSLCAETENSDKSFVINKRLKQLQNFLGVPLHCAVTEDQTEQEATAQFLEGLCAVRRDKEKEAREKIRADIEERCAVTGIFIERASRVSRKTKSNKSESSSSSPVVESEPDEEPPPSEKPTTTTSTPGSQAEVAQAMFEHVGLSDESLVRQLRQKCRAVRSDCTESEIACFIQQKGHLARSKPSPGGYLLTMIPNCFEGASFEQFRAELARKTAAEQEQRRRAEEWQKQQAAEYEHEKQKLLAQLADPNYPEKEKPLIRKILGLEEPERKPAASEAGEQVQKAGHA